MRKLMLTSLIFMLIFLGACSEKSEKKAEHGDHNPLGDIREETASIEKLPTFLDEKSDDMKTLYAAVAKSKDLLEQIPCYCGCGESANHKDNYDCFIHENNSDGSLTWDDHATKCQACLDIAAESIIQHNEGKSVKEIRDMIDEDYQNGNYPEPTPTPEV